MQISISTFLLLLSIHSMTVAQSMKNIESRIATTLEQSHEFLLKESELTNERASQPGWPTNTQSDPDYRDSAEQAHLRLKGYLIKTLPEIPNSLSAPIGRTGGVWVAAAPDGKMRSWAWDTDLGGTMPVIYLILEYLTPKGIRVVDMTDTSEGAGNCGWYDTIYHIISDSKQSFYLPRMRLKASTCLTGAEISAYSIEDTGLRTDVRIFKTPKKLLSSIDYEYNYFSNYDDSTGTERHQLELRDDGKLLTIPVVKNSGDPCGGEMTSKSLRYEFDGEHFVYKGISK